MLTTLEKDLIKDLIKRCFRTTLTIFLSNILVTVVASLRLSVWGTEPDTTVLVLLLLAGVICFTAGMQTAQLTGEANIGWAISCLACLVAGLATTVVLMGHYIVLFILIPEHSSATRAMAWLVFYTLSVIYGAFFILVQGLCCGVLAGWVGSKLGERWADEPRSEVNSSSSGE